MIATSEWDRIERKAEAKLAGIRKCRAALEDKQVDFRHDLSEVLDRMCLKIFDIDDLPKARSIMREAFGHWNDRLTQRWFSCGTALTSWEPIAGDTPAEIWLSCPVEDYPEELKGEHCDWEQITEKHTGYAFVCKTREEVTA